MDNSFEEDLIQVEPLKEGKLVFGHYELVRHLGSGAFGNVWQAKDTKLSGLTADVALKFLPYGVAGDKSAQKRLVAETEKLLTLKHENVVGCRGLADDGDMLWAIVMDYAHEGSLEDKLQDLEEGYFEADEELLKWLGQIATALDYIHGHQLYHRDLKPANVLLDHEGRAMLADFGLSSQLRSSLDKHSMQSEDVKQSKTSGSLPWISPQQMKGELEHPADDIYSLGATAYTLLTGEAPYYRGGKEAIMYQLADPSVKPIPISQRRTELDFKLGQPISADLEKTIHLSLSKKREERPTSGATFISSMLGGRLPHVPAVDLESEKKSKMKLMYPLLAIIGMVFIALIVWQPWDKSPDSIAPVIPAITEDPVKTESKLQWLISDAEERMEGNELSDALTLWKEIKSQYPENTAASQKVIELEKLKVSCIVKTNPNDAELFINGEKAGKSPSILQLPLGTHTLEIQKEGFQTFSKEVSVKNDKALEISEALRRVIEEKPSEMMIDFNGEWKAIEKVEGYTIEWKMHLVQGDNTISGSGYKVRVNGKDATTGERNTNVVYDLKVHEEEIKGTYVETNHRGKVMTVKVVGRILSGNEIVLSPPVESDAIFKIKLNKVTAAEKQEDNEKERERYELFKKKEEEVKRQAETLKAKKGELITFLNDYYQASNTGYNQADSKFYMDRLEYYFDSANISFDEMRKGHEKYMKVYPKRNFSVIGAHDIKWMGSNTVHAATQLKFTLSNQEKTVSGGRVTLLKIKYINEKPQIYAVETVRKVGEDKVVLKYVANAELEPMREYNPQPSSNRQREAINLVLSHIKAGNSASSEDQSRMFHHLVTYFNKVDWTPEMIRNDQISYMRKWPKRSYTITRNPRVIKSEGKYITVSVSLRAKISNANDAREVIITSHYKIGFLEEHNYAPKIFVITSAK